MVASTILRVRDPKVGLGEGGIEVQSFRSRFRARNHSAGTRSAVTSESPGLLVQSNKRSERPAMNDEPDRLIVVPAADDPGGHHDARFARKPRLQLRLLSVVVEMGVKVSDPHARHVIGHGRHLLDRLSRQAIHHGHVRLERDVAIPFNELLNDFLVHVGHLVDDVLDQRAHRGHPDDGESRGHHDLVVRFFGRGERGRQRDELASHGPQRQKDIHDGSEIRQQQMRFIHDDVVKLFQMVQRMREFHELGTSRTFHRYEQDGRRIVECDRVRAVGRMS